MEKVEAYNKAWRLGAKSNDFSLVDKIYHPDFKAVDAVSGVEVNIEAFKEALNTLRESIVITPAEVIVENDNFLKAHRYNRYTEADIFNSVTVSLFYKDGKIINQETVFQELDQDPSEGQDLNWEDYERLGGETSASFEAKSTPALKNLCRGRQSHQLAIAEDDVTI